MKSTLLVMVVLLATVAGCSLPPAGPSAAAPSPQAKALLGKWQTPHGGTMEFHPGGRLTMAGPSGSVEVTYTVSGNTLEMKKAGAANGIRHTLESVTDDQAVLVEDDGTKTTLQRVN